MPNNYSYYDIIIVGSGIVGAAAASALAKNTSLQIAVIEALPPGLAWQTASPYDQRVSAIALSSQRFFEQLGVWAAIAAKRISPYREMLVWDAAGTGQLHFSARALGEEALGFIIEDSVMRLSLLEHFTQYDNLHFLCPLHLHSLHQEPDHILLNAEGCTLKTQLLVAADGAESWVRQQAGIELTTWDYQHTAIIATVQTALPHQATARQRFLPTGPLAFLPLDNAHQCSLVWSAEPDYAAELLSLDDDAFCEQLSTAFGHTLGAITAVTQRRYFPLRMRHAKNYVRERIALIGDAAHTIHPLAGQGVNLGLLDAAALAEVVADACAKQRRYFSFPTLRRYERWRKGDTLAMLAAVEGLKRLFASKRSSVQALRSAGLHITNQLPLLKQFIANYALGKCRDLPTLAQCL